MGKHFKRFTIPKKKDVPWLEWETQKDIRHLYQLYNQLNKNALPLEGLRKDEEYRLVYITDSAVSTRLIDYFSILLKRPVKRSLDVVEINLVFEDFVKAYGSRECVLYSKQNPRKFGFGVKNYGKSWRLKYPF
jgi:hypothetical protein